MSRSNEENQRLRIIWSIPNVFIYIMFAGVSTNTLVYAAGLREISRMSVWVIAMITLLVVSVFGGFQIRRWIKEGEM
ncbi:hypothetical protein KJK41_12320 [Bacillus haikouensis]|nr:hypothetical protein KJK41_12320 [Bacillus haikouensis]